MKTLRSAVFVAPEQPIWPKMKQFGQVLHLNLNSYRYITNINIYIYIVLCVYIYMQYYVYIYMQYYIYTYIYTVYSNWAYFSWPSNFFRSKSLYQTSLESTSTKKKTEFWAHITTVIAMKNLFKTLETYLFSVSGARVQNPMSSLNILVETRIPLMDSDNPQYIG
jgi:sensor histidine kinase YesM